MDCKKLGFTCTALPRTAGGAYDTGLVCKMADAFLGKGFTYFSSDADYLEYTDEGERLLGEVLMHHPRETYLLGAQLPVQQAKTRAEQEAFFDGQLKRLGTDYLDVYLLFNLTAASWKQAEDAGSFLLLPALKETRQVRETGISFHDEPEVLDQILTAHPEIDLVQLQMNYHDWDHPAFQGEKCYHVIKKHNKKAIITEPLKAGALVRNLPEEAWQMLQATLPGKTAAAWAIHWTASYAIAETVLAGADSMEQLEENMAVLDPYDMIPDEGRFMAAPHPLYPEDHRTVEHVLCEQAPYPCRWRCGKCAEICPERLPADKYITLYNTEEFTGGLSDQKFYYNTLVSRNRSASACTACGKCLAVCPEKIDIPEAMKRVAEMFENQ